MLKQATPEQTKTYTPTNLQEKLFRDVAKGLACLPPTPNIVTLGRDKTGASRIPSQKEKKEKKKMGGVGWRGEGGRRSYIVSSWIFTSHQPHWIKRG